MYALPTIGLVGKLQAAKSLNLLCFFDHYKSAKRFFASYQINEANHFGTACDHYDLCWKLH